MTAAITTFLPRRFFLFFSFTASSVATSNSLAAATPSSHISVREDLTKPLTMLKFLSKVKIDFNASDPRVASCLEFLSQCNSRKARESNPACQLLVKRRLDDRPPKIALTFVDGAEEEIATADVPAQTVTDLIQQKGQLLEAEKFFRQYGQPWPVVIPAEELEQSVPDGLKTILQKENTKAFTGAELRVRLTSFNRFVDSKVDSSREDKEAAEPDAEEQTSGKKKKTQKRKKANEEQEDRL